MIYGAIGVLKGKSVRQKAKTLIEGKCLDSEWKRRVWMNGALGIDTPACARK